MILKFLQGFSEYSSDFFSKFRQILRKTNSFLKKRFYLTHPRSLLYTLHDVDNTLQFAFWAISRGASVLGS